MRIMALMDNLASANSALAAEHGLSIHVEYHGTQFIFDCGQSAQTWHNARKLGIDLNEIEFIVMSHGHYDHTLGLLEFPGQAGAKRPELYHGKDFFEPKYKQEGDALTYLGSGMTREQLTADGYRVHEAAQTICIKPGIHLVTGFAMSEAAAKNRPFVLRRDGTVVPDDFHDEVAVVLEAEQGLVVLVGCSHPGIETMLEAITAQFGRPITALFGGTHLVDRTGEPLDQAIEWFSRSGIQTLGLSHCTGAAGLERLHQLSHLTVNPLTVGTIFYL